MWMDIYKDRQTDDRKTDEWTEKQIVGQIDRCTESDRQIQNDGQTNRQTTRLKLKSSNRIWPATN